MEIYPLLKTAIREAPSLKVHAYLVDLWSKAEELLQISFYTRMLESGVPALAVITKLEQQVFPHRQPRTTIHRYRFFAKA